MPQHLVLWEKVAESHLQASFEKGHVRTALPVANGFLQGLTLADLPSPMSTVMESTSLTLPDCGPGTTCYTLMELLGSTICGKEPMLYNNIALLQLENGTRRGWAAEIRKIASNHENKPVYFAAAHLFGRAPFNAVVEVLADDLDLAHDVMLESTDVPGVAHVELLRIRGDRAFGMGMPSTA